ncbi:MAG TPA: hypothetical protein VFU01_19990, partial [Gemmatimonadaceae bacterium]|nr:hypothetical protein [Gemmatimonadaceae bacterium]
TGSRVAAVTAMQAGPSRTFGAIAFAIGLGWAWPLQAQGIELMPFAGYRFGGDFFELIAGRPVDLDGSPTLGVVVNVPLSNGLQVEALVTQQQATFFAPAGPFQPDTRWRATVGHAQVGGLQEFSDGKVRPFLTGLFGLTRYAAAGDSEVRFTIGAGGGVKMFPLANLGFRLDGRVHATFVDADIEGSVCVSGRCFAAVDVNMVWQTEFTAGIVVRLR